MFNERFGENENENENQAEFCRQALEWNANLSLTLETHWRDDGFLQIPD